MSKGALSPVSTAHSVLLVCEVVRTICSVNRLAHCFVYLQTVDENDTLVNFALALKKASLQNGVPGAPTLPVAKKPRGAAAANGKATKLR